MTAFAGEDIADAPRSRRAGAAWHAFAACVAALRFRWLTVLGFALGWTAGSLLRIRRAHVEAAMRRAGIADARAQAAKMYRALGASLFELLWIAGRNDARATERASFDAESRARLDAAFARGAGVVLAASHTGNWELAAASIAESFPLAAVTKRIHAASIDAFVRDARAARGWDATPAEGALARGRRALARGAIVAMMIDQVPERRTHAMPVDFLGAPALADRAPAVLAARAGAPLVVVAAMRDARGHQVMRVLRVLEPPREAHASRAWTFDATREATAALARFVREHPSQWLWMHRRWRML